MSFQAVLQPFHQRAKGGRMSPKTGRWPLVVAALMLSAWTSAVGAHVEHAEADASHATITKPPPGPQGSGEGPDIRTDTDVGTAKAAGATLQSWLGRWHPLLVHFPIALLLSAAIAELLFGLTKQETYRQALRFCLWGGTLSALAAAPLGWALAASGATEPGRILEAHRWAGSSATVLSVAVLWIHERAERASGSRRVLRLALAIQALAISGAGFLGGSLLYGIDHLAWRP
jgi:uncharacterized membrane protein